MTMMRCSTYIAIALCVIVQTAFAHSWIACAKYGVENGQYYDESKCSGYPRNWNEFKGSGFGVDTGYNYQVSGDVACRTPMTTPYTAGYTSQYPMGRYAAGERVCLAWPSKNHVAAPCTNPYIPEGGLKVMLSPLNPTSDPPISVFRSNVIADIGGHVNGVIDFKGYQNCPKFCENMDKSFCSQCFNLPSNLAPGHYVLLWYWIFNPDTTPYTSCMDIEITGSSGPAVTAAASTSAAATTSASASTSAAATTTAAASTSAAATTTASASTSAASTSGTTAPATTAPATTAPATSTSSSSTGSPAPSGALVVFDDVLDSKFTTSWSWQVSVSMVTSTYYSGLISMKTVMQPWSGLQIGASQTGIQWQGTYTSLSFAIKCDTANYNSVDVYFNQASKVRLALSTQWQVYTLSLSSSLAAPTSIFNPLGLVFFNNGPTPVNVYLDSIRLLP